MGISNVKTSRDLSSAIYYMLHGKGHDGSSQRYVSTRFENLTLHGAIQQTKAVREHFNKDKNVHGLTFIFSFSDKEIHHQDRVQQEKMMDSLHEVMTERFPNRQFGLVGQIDGDGKKFHIHAFVNSPDLTTGKLLDGRVKLHEHSKEMLTEAMNKANIQDLNKDVQVKQARKTNIAVQKMKSKNPNAYIWLEDLQNRISKALNDKNVTSTTHFVERMFQDGVTVKARKSSKTKTGHALSYKFRDEDGKERTVRASRLGTDFQLENIHSVILEHKALLQAEKEAEQRRQEEKRRREEEARERFQKHIDKVSEARKVQKSVSKPLVSDPRVKPLVQKQDSLQKLSEARKTILEPQPTKSVQKPVQANVEQNRPVSEARKVQKSVSKPLVSDQRVKPSVQKQDSLQKLSEARKTILEPQPTKSVQKPVETKIEQNRAISERESLLLKYIQTNKFVMWSENGRPFESLKNERRTFKEHMNIRAKRDLSDAELLRFAETSKFTVPEPNWQGKFICNSEAETLFERFEKSVSDKDLLERVKRSEQERQFQGQKQNTIDFER